MTTSLDWSPLRARRELGPLIDQLPRYIEEAQRGLDPVDRDWLYDRLTMMQLAMTQGWTAKKATAWLHETHRLLADLPKDILSQALDDAIKVSARGFMPTVGEVRAFADSRAVERKRVLHRLQGIQAAGKKAALPKPADAPPPTPEELAGIKAEFGLKTEPYDAAPSRPIPKGKPRPPTMSELADIAKEVGIDVRAPKVSDAAPIAGLSITEIFAQRDARRQATPIPEYVPPKDEHEFFRRVIDDM